MIANKKVIILGGAGFIGTNLAKKLAPQNNVLVIDSYLTGSKNNHVSGVKYIEGQAAHLQEIASGFQPNYVFHFGEYSRVEQSFKEPFFVLKNNSSLPQVLEFVKKNNAKLVYSCSSTIFNDSLDLPSLSPYTLTKKVNVNLINDMCKWEGIPYCITYFYNAFGPHEISSGEYSTVIAKFLRMRLNGQLRVPVHAPGTQKRNFTHVDDIVNGVLLATEYGEGDGYGIGCDDAYSIIEVCQMMGLEPNIVEGGSGNRDETPVKNEKVKCLGWESNISLENYIKDQLGLDNLKK